MASISTLFPRPDRVNRCDSRVTEQPAEAARTKSRDHRSTDEVGRRYRKDYDSSSTRWIKCVDGFRRQYHRSFGK